MDENRKRRLPEGITVRKDGGIRHGIHTTGNGTAFTGRI